MGSLKAKLEKIFFHKITFLTTQFDETPEQQEQLKKSIEAINKLGYDFQLYETTLFKIGFWWLHRRYSVLGDLFIILTLRYEMQ